MDHQGSPPISILESSHWLPALSIPPWVCSYPHAPWVYPREDHASLWALVEAKHGQEKSFLLKLCRFCLKWIDSIQRSKRIDFCGWLWFFSPLPCPNGEVVTPCSEWWMPTQADLPLQKRWIVSSEEPPLSCRGTSKYSINSYSALGHNKQIKRKHELQLLSAPPTLTIYNSAFRSSPSIPHQIFLET